MRRSGGYIDWRQRGKWKFRQVIWLVAWWFVLFDVEIIIHLFKVYDIVRYQITSLERSVETCYTIKTKKRTIILNDENKTGGKKKMLRYKIDILEALKEKGYTSYKIRKDKLIGEAQLTKIRSGEIASKETLNTICRLLSCQPGDILEYVEIDNK